MNFYVMTLFPEMVEQGMRTGIFRRALEKGLLSLEAVNIRDYTEDKHKKADDYPYGGGAGMLMQAQPVFRCYQEITERAEKNGIAKKGGENREAGLKSLKPRVVYLTPQGETFCQSKAKELAKEENLIFLCGHYEGIDERVLEEIVTDYISIGDYVLTGGELAAMVLMDAVARLVPGVLHNDVSADFETFYNDLLEYPQYSRPEVWHGKRVPEVLLCGDHRKIAAWRLEQSERKTKDRRPDMYERYSRRQHYIQVMQKKGKLRHMDMIESLRRGRGEIVQAAEYGILVQDREAKVYMLAVFDEDGEKAREVIRWLPEGGRGWQYVLHQECLLPPLEQFILSAGQDFSAEGSVMPVYMAVYTQRNTLPVRNSNNRRIHIRFRSLGMGFLNEVMGHYDLTGREYLEERLKSGNIYGAFIDENTDGNPNGNIKENINETVNKNVGNDGIATGKLAGFAGVHQEGSLGMLEVYEEYRGQGIGRALEAFMVNLHLSMGYTPYGMVAADNHVSLRLQKKAGLCISKEKIYWVAADG